MSLKEKEKEDNSGTDDLLKIDTAITSIARSRKRNTDSKEFVPLLTLFRLFIRNEESSSHSKLNLRLVYEHFAGM